MKKQLRIAILQTEYNAIHVTYWEQFIKDFISIVPVRLDNSDNFDCIEDYTLIIAPNIVNLDDSKLDNLRKAVKNGIGLIVTSKFPNCDMLGLSIGEKSISIVNVLIIERECAATMPFSKNDYFPFDREALNITNDDCTVLASMICNGIKKKSNVAIERIMRYMKSLLIYVGLKIDFTNVRCKLFNNFGLIFRLILYI